MQDETEAGSISAYQFGNYRFDVNRRELSLCADPASPQPLSSARLSCAEALILAYLLDHHDEICDKETLLAAGWQGRPISPNSLNVAIANIRRHLLPSPRCAEIRSTARKGYALHLGGPLSRIGGKQETPQVPQPELAGSQVPPQPAEPAWHSPSVRPLWQRGKRLWLSCLDRLLQTRTLCYVNLALLLCLLLAAGLLRFEWLGVRCEQAAGHSLCQMEAKASPAAMSPGTLTLISGHRVLTLSYHELDKEF